MEKKWNRAEDKLEQIRNWLSIGQVEKLKRAYQRGEI